MIIATLSTVEDLSRLPPEVRGGAKFVGIIKAGDSIGMACLLPDGSILTCLHVIYDYDTGKYAAPFEEMSVIFINGNLVHEYQVKTLIHDGSDIHRFNIRGQATNYDFAKLQINGNAIEDLQGSLALDREDYWGMPFNAEPLRTYSISAPIIYRNSNGQIYSLRIGQLAETLASSTNYTFPQLSSHQTVPGFSGMAIIAFKMHRPKLYAIHSGRNTYDNVQVGVKISEYLSHLVRNLQYSPQIYHAPYPAMAGGRSLIQYEALRNKEITQIRQFFQSLKQYLDRLIDENTLVNSFPPFTENRQVIDSHQRQHLSNKIRAGKSVFHPSICKENIINALANCVNKIISNFYQKTKAKHSLENYIKDAYEAYRKSTRFMINLGFSVGSDKDKSAATGIMLDGLGGKEYHIYPVNVLNEENKANAVIINADEVCNHLTPQANTLVVVKK